MTMPLLQYWDQNNVTDGHRIERLPPNPTTVCELSVNNQLKREAIQRLHRKLARSCLTNEDARCIGD